MTARTKAAWPIDAATVDTAHGVYLRRVGGAAREAGRLYHPRSDVVVMLHAEHEAARAAWVGASLLLDEGLLARLRVGLELPGIAS